MTKNETKKRKLAMGKFKQKYCQCILIAVIRLCHLMLCILLLTDSGSSSTDDQQKASDDHLKDASELGIEVIDHISTVAGKELLHVADCCVIIMHESRGEMGKWKF